MPSCCGLEPPPRGRRAGEIFSAPRDRWSNGGPAEEENPVYALAGIVNSQPPTSSRSAFSAALNRMRLRFAVLHFLRGSRGPYARPKGKPKWRRAGS
jgi:hypothetical protein